MFCVNCGQKINDVTVSCPNCGQKQQQAAYSAPVRPVPAGPVSAGPVSAGPNPAMPTYAGIPQAQPSGAYPAHQRKRHGCLIAFIIFIVVLLLAAAAVYFFVPGLLKPNDLGVKSSREAYVSASQKLGITKDDSPKTGKAEDYTITYGKPHPVSTSLTSEEITSFFNVNRPPYYPFKNVQVHFGTDGSIEAAGTVDTNYVFSQMLAGQYSKEDAQKALPMLGLIPGSVNVSFKVTGSVDNNRISELDIQSVKVMGVALPQSLLNSGQSFITETLNGYIGRLCDKDGAHIDHLGVSGGKLDLKGSLPSSIVRTPAA